MATGQAPGEAGARTPGRSNGRTGLRLLAPLLSGLLVVSVAPAPVAARSDRPLPSRDQVAAARQQVTERARDVGAIKASLLLANQRLEAAAVDAEIASEAYNGAMWRLQQARDELTVARADAAAARRTVEQQRSAIGALVASSYQQGADVTAMTAMMGADGPEGVLDQYVTFQGVSEKLQGDYDRFAATEVMAQGFAKRAEEARVEAVSRAAEARAARQEATAAAAAAQSAATQIAQEKERLVRELARAQDISVSLARRRQVALEQLARERAAERARQAAEETARQQAAEDARRRAEARRQARAAAQQVEKAEPEESSRTPEARTEEARPTQSDPRPTQNEPRPSQSEPRPSPSTPPKPASPPPAPAPPPPPAPPVGGGGADRAIAFAKAQVGEPYRWGAAGPDAWDCSGLMLEAWGQSGVYLPHYSVAQFYAGTPISASALRPGDLVFWGSSSSPESIHHVAMYIGDGQIVHAPRAGRPVAVESMYYWTPPNFFVRV